MATGAIALLIAPASPSAPSPRSVLLATGCLAFCVSDLAVARERFIVDSFWNKAWGLPMYFAAQCLIASSVL
jgi:uncharacterized membrane protein YhhN